jgi:hypothetical protein
MARFVQIVEYQTSRIDEVRALGNEFREQMAAKAQDGPKPLGGTITEDKDRPGFYLSLIDFESSAAAAEASSRPETQEFFGRLSRLMDGPPKFYNLEVVETWRMED